MDYSIITTPFPLFDLETEQALSAALGAKRHCLDWDVLNNTYTIAFRATQWTLVDAAVPAAAAAGPSQPGSGGAYCSLTTASPDIGSRAGPSKHYTLNRRLACVANKLVDGPSTSSSSSSNPHLRRRPKRSLSAPAPAPAPHALLLPQLSPGPPAAAPGVGPILSVLSTRGADCYRCLNAREHWIQTNLVSRTRFATVRDTVRSATAATTTTTSPAPYLEKQLWPPFVAWYFNHRPNPHTTTAAFLHGSTGPPPARMEDNGRGNCFGAFWDYHVGGPRQPPPDSPLQHLWFRLSTASQLNRLVLNSRKLARVLANPKIPPEVALKLTIAAVVMNPTMPGTHIGEATLPEPVPDDGAAAVAAATSTSSPAAATTTTPTGATTGTVRDDYRRYYMAELAWWVDPARRQIEYAIFFQFVWRYWFPDDPLPYNVPNLLTVEEIQRKHGIPSIDKIRDNLDWTLTHGRWMPVIQRNASAWDILMNRTKR